MDNSNLTYSKVGEWGVSRPTVDPPLFLGQQVGSIGIKIMEIMIWPIKWN